MKSMLSIALIVSLAGPAGPIARGVTREVSRLAALPDQPAADAGWSRVLNVAPGTEVLLTTHGSLSTSRVFVVADASSVTVLNLTDPGLPATVTRVVRRMASDRPERIAGLVMGEGFTQDEVHVGPDGVFVADRKIADSGQIVERIARADVVGIRTSKMRSTGSNGVMGGILGAAGGFVGGLFLGSAIENSLAPCRCDDPGLAGALKGAPIGAIAGGILGYYAFRHRVPDVIYRAP